MPSEGISNGEIVMGESETLCALRWRMEYGFERGMQLADVMSIGAPLLVRIFYGTVKGLLGNLPTSHERRLIRAYQWTQANGDRTPTRKRRAISTSTFKTLPPHFTPPTSDEQREIEADIRLRIKLLQSGKLPRRT